MYKESILGLNTNFDAENLNYEGFFEGDITNNISLLDYDSVIIDTDSIVNYYSGSIFGSDSYEIRLSKENSQRIINDYNTLKIQINDMLDQGKNIFVIIGKNRSCFLNYSLRSSNEEFNVFSFLPVKFTPVYVTGEKIDICCNTPYKEFFKSIDNLFYNAYFEAESSSTLLRIPNTNKAISAVFESGNGKIIILPRIPYEYEQDETSEEWNKRAFGFLSALFELNHKLKNSNNTHLLPKWTETFSILNESNEYDELNNELIELKKLTNQIEKRRERINNIQKYKSLVSASGDELEAIVKKVFGELGFSLEETPKGRSDIIAKYNEIDVVVEIKGVSKSAAEKHAAQLEKWASSFVAEKGTIPKAILIVNGYYELPLIERKEDVFPNQMLSYSKMRGHILMTTTQLLCLYIDIKENPSIKDERILELLTDVGVYKRYNDTKDFIKYK